MIGIYPVAFDFFFVQSEMSTIWSAKPRAEIIISPIVTPRLELFPAFQELVNEEIK